MHDLTLKVIFFSTLFSILFFTVNLFIRYIKKVNRDKQQESLWMRRSQPSVSVSEYVSESVSESPSISPSQAMSYVDPYPSSIQYVDPYPSSMIHHITNEATRLHNLEDVIIVREMNGRQYIVGTRPPKKGDSVFSPSPKDRPNRKIDY